MRMRVEPPLLLLLLHARTYAARTHANAPVIKGIIRTRPLMSAVYRLSVRVSYHIVVICTSERTRSEMQ